jgi:ribonuclease R
MTPPAELPSRRRIREALAQSERGPLKAKELARILEVPTDQYRAFRERLRELESTGDLYRNRSQRYAVPSEIHLVVGTLALRAGGDGFLRPDDPREAEVRVEARHSASAMDGDRVAVRVEGRPPGKAPEGRVVKILERGRPTVVGRYQSTRKFGFVSPLDPRVPRDVLVPEGGGGKARPGDVVVVRITQFGDARRNALGEVERVLGPMDAPGVDVLAILHGHGLPREFPPEVEAAARSAGERSRDVEGREDLRELLVMTIDPADARDHDDALSLRHLPGGNREVGIHIADVSHFVEEGQPVDLEALSRGTSVYLVDQVVPMLPHVLSSDLCSLREGEDRMALSLFVEFGPSGEVNGHRFSESIVRTRHGLHYQQVQGVLDGTESVNSEVDGVLRELSELAGVLRRRRRKRGSLDFDLPEARVVLDAEGVPIEIHRVVQLESHRLVEDFMILANEVVATELEGREITVPFRVHESPRDDRLEALVEFLGTMGHHVGRKKLGPRDLQRILDEVAGRPEENLVSTVILRSMSRARYDPSNLGHFGLASSAYLHFTSPIRRYPDLVVHRMVKEVLLGGTSVPEGWEATVTEIADRASERERVAQQAERDSVEMKKIEYMRRHLGDEFDGTIAGVTSFGFFVLLERVFVEGLVHVSTLDDDYYAHVPEAHALVGSRNGRRFRIGDPVRVQVVRADKEERKIDFRLLEGGSVEEGGRRPSARTRGGGGGKGGGGRKGGSRGGRGGGKKGKGSGGTRKGGAKGGGRPRGGRGRGRGK